MARRQNRFTIYDAMEAQGVFDSNPANQFSKDSNGLGLYKGPIEYPKMLYHPTGEERVVKAAEAIATPFGPKMVGEEKRMISQTVNSKEEEDELRKQGWHARPIDALKARAKVTGEAVPQTPADPRDSEMEKLRKMVEDLQIKNVEMEHQLATASGKTTSPVGTVKTTSK